jgi:hypothetical protein
MHFENARGGKATHQRLAHTCRVGTGLGRKQQRFAHCFDGQCHDDLVGDLAGLTSTGVAHVRDVLAHQGEQRFGTLERGCFAANHDRECCVTCTDFTA